MSEIQAMKYYEYQVVGKVYAGSADHARHTVFWSLDRGDTDNQILGSNVSIKGGVQNDE